MNSWLGILLGTSVAYEQNLSSSYIYCHKIQSNISKALIYASKSCFELELTNTNNYTFFWNNIAKSKYKANGIDDFGVGCADIKDYMNGGICWYGPSNHVNCQIMYSQLAYINKVLPTQNVTRSIFDYEFATQRAERVASWETTECASITDGLLCKTGTNGILEWYYFCNDRTVNNQSATIKVSDVPWPKTMVPNKKVMARDYTTKFKELYQFFFYVKNSHFKTASEMIPYGSNITPLNELCMMCTNEKCG